MNIAWVTVRRWNDMCTTTTDALIRGLVRRGHEITVLNADRAGSHDGFLWKHVPLQQSNWPGRKAATLATSARTWFKQHADATFDVILVDWPLAPSLGPSLAKRGAKLVLMDRSPPADATFLARLQWRSWTKAWSMVKKGVFSTGLVVSPAHQEEVVQQIGVNRQHVHCIPAGVNLDEFRVAPVRKDGPWKFVYHGRLDKHRGVLALPMLMRKLANHGFNVHLTLIGDGDALDVLQAMAESDPLLSVSSQVPRQEIPAYLEQQHIGLLPMPASRVWSLASPLKRSEYLAAGLLVYGMDHTGHHIEGASDAWFKLAPQEDFHEDAIEWMSELDGLPHQVLQERSDVARSHAEAHCSWETIAGTLEELLQAVSLE
jgi:glycosyltransferase involved in cell wall biosynthesis